MAIDPTGGAPRALALEIGDGEARRVRIGVLHADGAGNIDAGIFW